MRDMTATVAAAAFLAAATAAGSAAADEAGERLFGQRCGACHSVEPGQSRAGPHLARLGGRKAGAVAGFRYSAAMQNSGLIWDRENLDRYIANPRATVPGTTMILAVADAGQRASIIDFLLGK